MAIRGASLDHRAGTKVEPDPLWELADHAKKKGRPRPPLP
jgi:hypothetical protein